MAWMTAIVLTGLLAATAWAQAAPEGSPVQRPAGGALAGERYRVIISSDIGGSDPDDTQSLVHYLVYADLFDTEGLISSPPGKGRATDVLKVLEAYEKDLPDLRRHSDRYPSAEALRAMTKQGAIDVAPEAGFREPTEGSRWIIERAAADDERPLYVLVWGSMTDLAQALHDEPGIKSKLRIYCTASWNRRQDPHAHEYVLKHHPDLWFIDAETTFRGMYIGGEQGGDLDNERFMAEHVAGHGALGTLCALQKVDNTRGDGARARIKMGDTPTVLYLLAGDPAEPTTEHWGGRFVRPDASRPYWTCEQEAGGTETLGGRKFPGARTVNRWREQYLRDWQQRMDRCR